MEAEDKKVIVENTTVQTLGIAALAAGVAALQLPNQVVNGLALCGVGMVILAFKYYRNL
jgi:hypothetical protein